MFVGIFTGAPAPAISIGSGNPSEVML
jgi:hypothetical protein